MIGRSQLPIYPDINFYQHCNCRHLGVILGSIFSEYVGGCRAIPKCRRPGLQPMVSDYPVEQGIAARLRITAHSVGIDSGYLYPVYPSILSAPGIVRYLNNTP